MGLEPDASPPSAGVDLGPRLEVIRRELWHRSAPEFDNCRDPTVVGKDDVREAVAEGRPSRPGGYRAQGLFIEGRGLDLIPRPVRIGEEVLQGCLVHRSTLGWQGGA